MGLTRKIGKSFEKVLYRPNNAGSCEPLVLILLMSDVFVNITITWRKLHISCKTCVQSYCIHLTIQYV